MNNQRTVFSGDAAFFGTKAVLISALVVLVLLGWLGRWFYRAQERQHRLHVEDQLTAIAQLKVREIVRWRAKMLDDAEVLSESPFLVGEVARFLAAPKPAGDEDLLRSLRSFRRHYLYSSILLVDPDGGIRLRLNSYGYKGKSDGGHSPALAIALRERRMVLSELYQGPTGSPCLSAIAPLFSGTGKDAPALGAIILIRDARQFLYPLIRTWPTPSATAETLLVRRDGDDALFLNDLRHLPDAALHLRVPLTRIEVPAVRAVRGEKGVVAGRDYRGIKVLSVILPIPDSPWFMVAKIDEDEAFASWRFLSLLLLLAGAAVPALIGTIGLGFWQRGKKAHYRELYGSESRLRLALERHSIILKGVGDGIIATDASGRVELLNPVAEALTGWSNEEASGRPLHEVFHIVNEQTRAEVENPVEKVLRTGYTVMLANHTLLIARDGRELPIADSGAPVMDEDGKISGVVLVFRDQSEERFSQRLTQLRLDLVDYAASHTLDELLTRTVDEICRQMASPIGFFHFVEADLQGIVLQQWSSRTLNEFCRSERRGLHYDIDRAGVWADCIRERKPAIHNDYASLAGKKGLPEGHAGIVRELVVPVLYRDKVVAVLGVGNKQVDYTERDAEIVSFFADVAWHIAEAKRGEEDLRQSRVQLAESNQIMTGVLNHTHMMAVFLDPRFNFIWVNRAYAATCGNEPAFFPGKNHFDLYPHEENQAIFQRVVDTGEPFYVAAKPFEFPDKPERGVTYWDWSLIPVRDGGGQVTGLVFTLAEETQRVRAEQALQENIAFTQTVLDNLPVGIAVNSVDPEVQFQYMNDNFARFYRTTREELAEPNAFWTSVYEDPEFRETIRTQVLTDCASGDPQRMAWTDVPIARQGQETTYVSARNIQVPDKALMISTVWDVSERKRAEMGRQSLQDQFFQAQKMESVGRLAGGVAHDFNNMLTVILGNVEIAMEQVDPGQTIHHDLEEIRAAARRSADLTRQLLAFARRQTVAPKVLDLNETIEGMFKMLRRLIGEDVELTWLPGPGIWPVMIDPAQIDQILANLCVNARDAIDDVGKITIETGNIAFNQGYCGDHAGFVPGDFVLLALSDNGSGIDREILEHIFEPFFTTKQPGEGTGLGLATVYGIVKQNKGFVNVYSEPDSGTTFKIYLPRYEGEVVRIRREEVTEPPRGHGETVLLVEDDPAILAMGEKMLTSLGYTVLAAQTSDRALAAATGHSGEIRLLLTDVVMPEMNGRELAERIAAIQPGLRCLFMSGYTANVIARHGVLKEGVQFIQKPFSKKDLAVKIREVLAER